MFKDEELRERVERLEQDRIFSNIAMKGAAMLYKEYDDKLSALIDYLGLEYVDTAAKKEFKKKK